MKKAKILELNSDKDLVASVRQGKTEAFDILFMKYCQKLYHFAHGFLRSHEEAEGVVQEVFVQLWEQRVQLKPEYSFNSYIFTVTKNRVFNIIRKRVYERKYLDSLSVKQVLHDFATEDQLNFRELLEISQEAIDALPPKRKQVFRMSREQGMTYEEIARHLGVSRKTVENQMVEALKALRSHLQRHAQISFPLILLIVMG